MTEYRVEYTIVKSDDGFETQDEVGFGSSGTWSTVDQCAHMVASDLQNETWEVDNRPIPALVVDLLAEIEERQQRVQQLRAIEQRRVDALCRKNLERAARAAGLS